LNLFGQATNNTADVSVSAVATIQALPGLPIVVVEGLCDKGNVTLDFQSGGKSTAGWETYYIDATSTTEVRNLWRALPDCAGQPVVDIGYCGNIANGVNRTIFNEILRPMFKNNPNDCYLIPVIKQGGNLTSCQNIKDWARFCPAPGDAAFPNEGLYGTVTCGQSTWTSRDTKCYVPRLIRDAKSGM
jgi:hypothetical protein